MTIIARLRQRVRFAPILLRPRPLARRWLVAAPQLNQSSSVNQVGLNCIYPFMPRGSSKQSAQSTRGHSERPAPRAKSP